MKMSFHKGAGGSKTPLSNKKMVTKSLWALHNLLSWPELFFDKLKKSMFYTENFCINQYSIFLFDIFNITKIYTSRGKTID